MELLTPRKPHIGISGHKQLNFYSHFFKVHVKTITETVLTGQGVESAEKIHDTCTWTAREAVACVVLYLFSFHFTF